MPVALTWKQCLPFSRIYVLPAAACVVALVCSGQVAGQAKPQNVPVGDRAYVVIAADCASCHTAGLRQPFAGGLPVNSPFGKIYSTNITPDPDYGIGRYNLNDFTRALREGIAKDGRQLYPAMPYTSFAAMSDHDIRQLYEYFMHDVAPVAYKPPATTLAFPFDQRWGIGLWDGMFATRLPFKANESHDMMWNRGAYLVQAPGHCGSCHTPRSFAYQEKADNEAGAAFLSGATLDNWHASDLTGNLASGLGRWNEDDIVAFLKTGRSEQGDAFGSMQDVISNSTQYMTDTDLKAIAHYLKSLPAHGERSAYQPGRRDVAVANSSITTGRVEKPGTGYYLTSCAKCHQVDGSGQAGKYPKLGGSSAVVSNDPTSLIRIVLQGAKTVPVEGAGEPVEMPAFGGTYTDLEIAETVNFIRTSWGNRAAPVSTHEVAALRERLKR